MLIPSRSQVLAAVGTVASLSLATPAFGQAESSLPTIRPGACVERLQAGTEGNGDLRARFWYERFGDAPAVLEIPRGPDNELTPADTTTLYRVPVPERFEAVGNWAFEAMLGAEPMTWTLRDPDSREGGTITVDGGYASRCVEADFTTSPDPQKPSGSTVRIAWIAKVSGVDEFREPGAPDVPWSAWRESCTLDDAVLPCEEADVVLADLAPGAHVFRVFAQAPLPADIGPAAGTATNPYAFRLEAPFTVERTAPPAAEPTPPPVSQSPPPIEPAAPMQPARPALPATPAQLTGPAQPATPAQPAAPASCQKRKLSITVPKRGGKRIRSASVTVDGKRVRVRKRNGRFVATVPAAAIRRETVLVKITARYVGGKKRVFKQRMNACA